MLDISTHSLTRRLTGRTQDLYVFPNISTHSLTRRLTVILNLRAEAILISTHNLTRRLTYVLNVLTDEDLFQLTASRGGWRSFHIFQFFNYHFNSQPHEEADHSINVDRFFNCISTHSLTRRLTKSVQISVDVQCVFQLTASRGGWRLSSARTIFCESFQLTASRGGWQYRGLSVLR